MWKEVQGDFVWSGTQTTFNSKSVLMLSASYGLHPRR